MIDFITKSLISLVFLAIAYCTFVPFLTVKTIVTNETCMSGVNACFKTVQGSTITSSIFGLPVHTVVTNEIIERKMAKVKKTKPRKNDRTPAYGII